MDVLGVTTLGWVAIIVLAVWFTCGAITAIIIWAKEVDERAQDELMIERMERAARESKGVQKKNGRG